MTTEQAEMRQHWIYVLGGAELRQKARTWAERKTRQGKLYRAIEGSPAGLASGQLTGVGNEDVLYVFAGAVEGGRLGESALAPGDLAAHMLAEGLDRGHRSLKLFVSYSGDSAGSPSYAELVFEAMRPEYPRIMLSGYHGMVDAEGFDGHKTAGLSREESLAGMSRETWVASGSRAQQNRVQFPPG
jgi:hypothetical protein